MLKGRGAITKSAWWKGMVAMRLPVEVILYGWARRPLSLISAPANAPSRRFSRCSSRAPPTRGGRSGRNGETLREKSRNQGIAECKSGRSKPQRQCSSLRERCSSVREECSSLRERCSSLREGCSSLREECSSLREWSSSLRERRSNERERSSSVRETCSNDRLRFSNDGEQGSSDHARPSRRKLAPCR